MSKEIKHTIHIGEKSFIVSEWLYNYFITAKKENKVFHRELVRIISGVKTIKIYKQ